MERKRAADAVAGDLFHIHDGSQKGIAVGLGCCQPLICRVLDVAATVLHVHAKLKGDAVSALDLNLLLPILQEERVFVGDQLVGVLASEDHLQHQLHGLHAEPLPRAPFLVVLLHQHVLQRLHVLPETQDTISS